MAKAITEVFWKSSSSAAASAALSAISTIFIVRFIGADAYSSQIVDLAVVSLIMIFLEMLPSSLIVFKVQDDDRWRDILIVQLIISAILTIFLIEVLRAMSGVFHYDSSLISLYSITIIIKRFNDVNLQAAGKVHHLFLIDLASGGIRLLLMLALFAAGVSPELNIWSSLAISGVVTQAIGVYFNRAYLGSVGCIRSLGWASELRSSWLQIVQYYPSIALKRISDSLVPLIASQLLSGKDALAVFLLVYRSLGFVSVFSRIFEAILNKRSAIEALEHQAIRHIALLGGASHSIAFSSSIFMVVLSGQSVTDWLFIFVLTATTWINVAFAVLRAKSFASYSVWPVTLGYATNITIFLGLSICVSDLGMEAPRSLALSILLAQAASLVVITQVKFRV